MRFHQVALLRWGSILILAISVCWFIERAFNLLIPGFSAIIPN